MGPLESGPPSIAADSSSYIVRDQQRMTRARNYFAWQARLVRRVIGRRVIEAGCGIGNFTGNLLDREAVLVIDQDPACIHQLQLRFPDCPNIHARVGDVQSIASASAFRPDSIVCLNVLEHVADDREALSGMARVLPSGGVVVLLVPAFPALYGLIDRNLHHRRRYTRRALRSLASAASLEVSQLRFFNSIGFLGWWANARILHLQEQSARQIALFDSLVPALSRIEDLVPPPFGQSLFAVLRKP